MASWTHAARFVAPKYNRNADWDWTDRSRDKDVYDYYRTPLWYA